MKKIAVVLCGCGCMDGSEIHESVMTLLAIDRNGCEYEIFAPDADQYHVINHYTNQVSNEKRNMLVEAARIARGKIYPLPQLKAADFDAVIFPGGFGAAKNLFDYAINGTKAKVMPEVERVVKEFYKARKPIGALCIAPVLIARILGCGTITVGNNSNTIADVEAFGAQHINTKQTEVIADKENMIYTTPCYMLPASISDIADCANNLVKSMLENF